MGKVFDFNSLFSTACPLCGAKMGNGSIICQNCSDHIILEHGQKCTRCGKEINSCICSFLDLHFDRCVFPFVYGGSVRTGIIELKKNGFQKIAKLFLSDLESVLYEEYRELVFDSVCYVPRHISSMRKEGVNSAKTIAGLLSESAGIPMKQFLRKIKKTAKQSSLKAVERRKNLNGAFKAFHKKQLNGKNILLVDDIITTGATFNECAKTLKDAGAMSVYCIAVAGTVFSEVHQNEYMQDALGFALK